MPKTPIELVDVSDIAHDVGFHILVHELAFAEFRVTRADGTSFLPVYLTRALWAHLGGEMPHATTFLSDLHHVLYHAHLAAFNSMVEQSAWRAGIHISLAKQSLHLWIILGHSYSNGFSIGFGPGDFW